MRILVDVPLNLDIHESVLEELLPVLIKVRNASQEKPNDDQGFWGQMVKQVEWKLEYIKSRQGLIEQNKQIEEERREQIRKEFEELQRQQREKFKPSSS